MGDGFIIIGHSCGVNQVIPMSISGDQQSRDVVRELPKKIRIAGAWFLDKHFHQKKAAEALNVSTEYIRQVVGELESQGGEYEKLSESDIEWAQSYEVEAALYHVLLEHNAFRGLPDIDIKDTLTVDREQIEEEIYRLRILENSAEHGDDGERAYVARTAREFLEELLDDD